MTKKKKIIQSQEAMIKIHMSRRYIRQLYSFQGSHGLIETSISTNAMLTTEYFSHGLSMATFVSHKQCHLLARKVHTVTDTLALCAICSCFRRQNIVYPKGSFTCPSSEVTSRWGHCTMRLSQVLEIFAGFCTRQETLCVPYVIWKLGTTFEKHFARL